MPKMREWFFLRDERDDMLSRIWEKGSGALRSKL
jgi:hypothetical protein